MAKVLLILLSVLLGFFFMFSGVIKLTPAANKDLHEEMKKNFRECTKVFPFASQTGFKPDVDQYRIAIGALELVCAVILIVIPGKLKAVADFLLFSTMVGAVYTHYALQHPVEKMVPALVAGLLVLLHFVLLPGGSKRKEERSSGSTTTTTAKRSAKKAD